MMPRASTRLANHDDIPVISLFERELARQSFPDDPIEDLAYHEEKLRKALVKEPEGMVVIVDSETDELLAWLWMVTRRTLATGERYGVIRSVYVRPSGRGRGLGRMLGDYALRYFEKLEIGRIVAKLHARNEAGARLLQSIGFDSVHVTYEYRGDVPQPEDDAIGAAQ